LDALGAQIGAPAAETQQALPNIWRLLGGVSVRTKILGIVLGLTIALGLGITLQVRSVMERTFLNELDIRGLSVVSDLAARSVDPILLNDTFSLHDLLVTTVENHPDALYAYATDADGEVIAHAFGGLGFPAGLLDLRHPDGQTKAAVTRYQSVEGRIHSFSMPIFEGRSGTVFLGLIENRLRSIVNAVTGQLLLTTLVVSVFGVLAAALLTWLLTRPILDLVNATESVAQGDLSVRSPHWADDEIGTLADAFNGMVEELEAGRLAIAEKDAGRTRLLEQLITAQEEERKRVARELHDGVGQALTSLIWGIKSISDPDEVGNRSVEGERLRLQATDLLQQVRLLSRELRPSVLDDLGLAVALERYAKEFGALHPGVVVDMHVELPNRPPPLVEIAVYRVIQEAMTNAARHSGGDTVSVILTQRGECIRAIVEDNGHGFDPFAARRNGQSVGLHAMAERMELIGGTLEIESSAAGTSVYVETTGA
jgi:signal transduction histidine kinase